MTASRCIRPTNTPSPFVAIPAEDFASGDAVRSAAVVHAALPRAASVGLRRLLAFFSIFDVGCARRCRPVQAVYRFRRSRHAYS